jgi:hypothetical protein
VWLWWRAGGVNTAWRRWLGRVCAGVIACCAFAGWSPCIAYGARPPLGSASGLGGLALDRVWHSVEGCRVTPRGCGLLLVHGRVYGQGVLGCRRLWARALVPGLNHCGLVLETVCPLYGVARRIGKRSPDGMQAHVGYSWLPLVEGCTASRCAAVLCARL